MQVDIAFVLPKLRGLRAVAGRFLAELMFGFADEAGQAPSGAKQSQTLAGARPDRAGQQIDGQGFEWMCFDNRPIRGVKYSARQDREYQHCRG
jgi:hypothetical protein